MLIEHGQKLFSDENMVEDSKNINLYEFVNEYHYNFYSAKEYKISCIYSIFTYFCLTSAILSVLIFLVVSIIIKELSHLISYSIFLYFISMIGFGIGVIRNQNFVNKQIIYKFRKYISESEKTNYIKNKDKILLSFNNKDLLQAITLRWFDEKISRTNYLYVANEISKTSELLELHSKKESRSLTSLIYTPDSKVRITSYFIALISLISVIVIKTSDATVFYEIFSKDMLLLYFKLLFLAIQILCIVFLYERLASDILTIFQDKFDDIFKQDKVPNKHRVNRLINVLVLNHENEIEK